MTPKGREEILKHFAWMRTQLGLFCFHSMAVSMEAFLLAALICLCAYAFVCAQC